MPSFRSASAPSGVMRLVSEPQYKIPLRTWRSGPKGATIGQPPTSRKLESPGMKQKGGKVGGERGGSKHSVMMSGSVSL